jgi:large subunit ribosomal protein L28
MSQQCDLCGKKPLTGNNVSHSNRHTRRRFEINLQRKKLTFGGLTARLRVCTSCLKTYTRKVFAY